MSPSIQLTFKAPNKRCTIEVGQDLLYSQMFLDLCRSLGKHMAIITDDAVLPLFGEPLLAYFKHHRIDADLFSFPTGETYKTRETKEIIEDEMQAAQLGRDTAVIALGGGVVTDLAGFVAATYCRGIPYVMVPTTLLAMVDAGIGGKTGINTPTGKNLIGAIHQPHTIVIDINLVHTLPERELSNGAVEMIKHGAIADAGYFQFLEQHAGSILARKVESLQEAIFRSCEIKSEITMADETEQHQRRLLNFGHTVGHVIERVKNYQIAHGQAVAIGMLVEGYIAYRLGYASFAPILKMKQAFKKFQVNLWEDDQFPIEEMERAMLMDKKAADGVPRFVLIQEIGEPLPFDGSYCTVVGREIIREALEWMNHDRRACEGRV